MCLDRPGVLVGDGAVPLFAFLLENFDEVAFRWLEEVIRAAERQGDPPEPFVGFESGFRAGRLGVVHAHMAGLAAPRRPAIGRVAP